MSLNGLDFGMKSLSDSTSAFQKALNAAIAQQQPLFVPKGIYIINSGIVKVKIPSGKSLVLYGDGVETVFKRKDKSITKDGQKLIEISSDKGSVPRVELHSFSIDGNARMNPLPAGTTDTYLWEHCANIQIKGFLGAKIMDVIIHDITAFDPVADHILFPGYTNCYIDNAHIYNFNGFDRNRTRSDITITGGMRQLLIENSTATRIESELNDPYDEGVCKIIVNNCVVTSRLDIVGKNKSDGSVTLEFRGSQITANDINFHMIKGSLINSTVDMTFPGMTRVNNLQGFVFDNILFKIEVDSKGTIIAPLTFYPYDDNNITIQNSTFAVNNNDPLLSPDGFVIVLRARSGTSISMSYKIVNCTFDARLKYNMDINRSDTVVLENNKYSGSVYSVSVYSSSSSPVRLTIIGGDMSAVKGQFLNIKKSDGLILVRK
ncbi:hypothetical protein [Paenibacillus montanisoli]|uniref:Pectate lyase superfamily protein domain-containing protein n=1 Tax=Paenibacillus montanisoli TaxID=2081970 RepID=A0A328U4C4_9BACL|nr:hypothetical protein [Paenibacillus montanisoli]RAP77470.1 hypothetical protein DL346_03040 [Paenibacillus montanisoli]